MSTFYSYNKMSAEDKLIKAKAFLNRSHPFFSYIILHMVATKKPTVEVPTLAINRWGDLSWNEDFVNKCTLEELMGSLSHEAMHVSTLTFQREGKRDYTLWNIATDIAINYLLVREGLHMPAWATDLIPESNGSITIMNGKVHLDVSKMCAEEIYDELLKHCDKLQTYYSQEGDGSGKGKGTLDKHDSGDDSGEQGKENSNINKWKKVFTEAATAAKMRGKLSSEMGRLLDEVLHPKIDWRKVLYNWIVKDIPYNYTMAKPGRRFYGTGIYFPSVVKENLELIIGVDVSGSISGEEYKRFMSEICGICTSFNQIRARVIYWSTYVDPRDDIVITQDTIDDLISHKISNSGGTTLSCMKDYIEKNGYNSRLYVVLTDGYIEHDPKLPEGSVLFVLSQNGSDEIVRNYGHVTNLSDVEDDE